MLNIILLRGLAASGKTTLMNKIKGDNPKHSTWSKDEIFDVLLSEGVEWSLANKETYNRLFEFIRANKNTGNTLLVDAPYYREEDYRFFVKFCNDLDVSFRSVLVTCSNEEQWRQRFNQRSKNPKPNQTITDYDEMKNYYGSMYIEPIRGEFVFDSCDSSGNQYKNLIDYL